MVDHCIELEGPSGKLIPTIQNIQEGYKPSILLTLVNKRVTTRFFERVNGNVINPDIGTVIDKSVVQSNDNRIFDFYLVSNRNPTSATALPVHYQVVINTTQLTSGDIKMMTYHQCYGYFGFQGPIKTPACVMYAYKIASYALENKFVDRKFSKAINPKLSSKIHYI